jgi:hypothetical protein
MNGTFSASRALKVPFIPFWSGSRASRRMGVRSGLVSALAGFGKTTVLAQ